MLFVFAEKFTYIHFRQSIIVEFYHARLYSKAPIEIITNHAKPQIIKFAVNYIFLIQGIAALWNISSAAKALMICSCFDGFVIYECVVWHYISSICISIPSSMPQYLPILFFSHIKRSSMKINPLILNMSYSNFSRLSRSG